MKLKRLISLSLSIAMSLTLCSAIAASADSGNTPTTPMEISEEELFYVKQTDFLTSIGNSLLMQRSSGVISLSVPHLYQQTSTWASEPMYYYSNGVRTYGGTIGTSGCALTSFTMVQQFMGGTHNPKQVNNALNQNTYDFNWYTAGNTYDMEVYALRSFTNSSSSQSSALSLAYGGLTYGLPAIIGMKNSSGGSHFVVIGGYSGGYYRITDPDIYNDYTTLNSYTNSGYYISSVRIYKDPDSILPDLD